MMRFLTVSRSERVAILRDGQFDRLLGPGRHPLWTGFSVVEEVWFDLTAGPQRIDAADGLPAELEGSRLVEVGAHQVAVVRKDGRETVLQPGRYRLWETGAGVDVLVFDVLAEPVALGDEDRLVAGAGASWTEVRGDGSVDVVLEHDGRPQRVLDAGRYRAWTRGPWALRTVPRSLQVLELAAQDVVTKDQVPVRVKPAGAWKVVDALAYLQTVSPEIIVYGAVQLALREVLAGVVLDALTEAREGLTDALLARARAHLSDDLGVALEAVWVKDLILPGEVKDVVHKVTLARKEAEAKAIRRREEVAQTRQLANTAKLLEQSPVLLRLKELEAMGELVSAISGKLEKLVIVGGSDLASQVRLQQVVDETR